MVELSSKLVFSLVFASTRISVNVASTCWLFQIVYEGEIYCDLLGKSLFPYYKHALILETVQYVKKRGFLKIIQFYMVLTFIFFIGQIF